MFTGIIEDTVTVTDKKKEGSNCIFTFSTPLAVELKVDQSISHNGVCLTVTAVLPDERYQVVAVEETLTRSNLNTLQVGSLVNMERAMILGSRIDGHLVQGHVDTTGICEVIQERAGSWHFEISFDSEAHAKLVVEKGSVCMNGVSLTCFSVTDKSFEIAVIPYTYHETNFHLLRPGDQVNLEFDVVGKYVQRMLEGRNL